jgi:hypothetical protein
MILMEYPPMRGGVGRYCKKLVDCLKREGVEVLVVSNVYGKGDLGISPDKKDNFQVLLKLVKEVNPDLVHVQYEQGMYGMRLDPIDLTKTGTNIEKFYDQCTVPIVSTLHSVYTFREWMNLIVPLQNKMLRRRLRLRP